MKTKWWMAVLPLFGIFAMGCGTTINPGQMGVKYLALKHGPAVQNEVKPEGYYPQWAWNSIVVFDVVWQSKTEEVEILTADDLHVNTKVTVTYRPRKQDLQRLALEVGTRYYDQVIQPPFLTIARSEFARHAHNDLAKEGPAIEQQILAKLREAVASKPIEIDRVSINHIQFDSTVTSAISAKLAAKQRLEQKEFEMKIAERDADIARTAARGRADVIRTEAQGEAEATVLRGQAQAHAQADITKTLTPNYLRYKAFDSDSTRYYFVPVGRDGMPILVGTDSSASAAPQRPVRNRNVGRRYPALPDSP